MADLGGLPGPDDIIGRIEGKTHIQPVRVYYEETDLSGIVYHANFVRFIERGRSNYLRLLGVNHGDLLALEEPLAFTVTRLEMDYLMPAKLDDTLEIHSRYTRMTGARLHGLQIVKRDGVDLVQARIQAACINLEGKPRRFPKAVREALLTSVCDEDPA